MDDFIYTLLEAFISLALLVLFWVSMGLAGFIMGVAVLLCLWVGTRHSSTIL